MARALAAARIGVGIALLVAPGPAARTWIGDASTLAPVKALTRGFGARDLALGVGVLRALEAGDPVRPWLRASAASDAADAVANIVAFRQLPKLGRVLAVAVATGAAVAGFRLADALD